MGLFSFFRPKGKLGLTSHDRKLIFKLFGSFNANLFAQNDQQFLQEGYEGNVDVYAVIKKIIDTSKAVPWVVERQSGDTWEIIDNTSIHELMANPNPTKGFTWDDIEEMLLVYLLANGNNYMVGNTQINRTQIEELEILPPFSITVQTAQDFFLPGTKYKFEMGTSKRTYEQEEIQHVRFFNPAYTTVQDSITGLSPIQVACAVVQASNDKWDAAASLFQNRGAIGLITSKGDRPLTEDEGKQLQEHFNHATAGTHNYGKTKVTNKDLSFIQMAMSPQDLQIIEQGVIGLRAICNVYGLDSSLFNDPANKTFNNRKEAEKALYTNSVIPLSNKIAQAHTNFIAKNHFPDGNVRMRQDFSGVEVLQEDLNEKSKTIVSLRNSGIITANEAREAIKHEPASDDNADKLIVVNNNIPLEDIDADTNTGGE